MRELCPTPRKKAFGDRASALRLLRQMQSKPRAARGLWEPGATSHGLAKRVYKCECGSYHLTTMSRADVRKLRPGGDEAA